MPLGIHGCGHDLDSRRDPNESGCGSAPQSWCRDNAEYNAGRVLSKRRIRAGLCNGNPGSIPNGSEALFTPPDAAVLTVEELTDKMRDSDAALDQALRTRRPSEAVISITKSARTAAVVEALRFFASHAWTGTHPGQDFGRKIPSAYCVVRVHNAAISASGRDGLYTVQQ